MQFPFHIPYISYLSRYTWQTTERHQTFLWLTTKVNHTKISPKRLITHYKYHKKITLKWYQCEPKYFRFLISWNLKYVIDWHGLTVAPDTKPSIQSHSNFRPKMESFSFSNEKWLLKFCDFRCGKWTLLALAN